MSDAPEDKSFEARMKAADKLAAEAREKGNRLGIDYRSIEKMPVVTADRRGDKVEIEFIFDNPEVWPCNLPPFHCPDAKGFAVTFTAEQFEYLSFAFDEISKLRRGRGGQP